MRARVVGVGLEMWAWQVGISAELTGANLSSEASMLSGCLGRVHVTVNEHLQTTPANNTRGMTVSKH